jgi:hypothetical protein
VIGTNYVSNYKSNYYTIRTTNSNNNMVKTFR